MWNGNNTSDAMNGTVKNVQPLQHHIGQPFPLSTSYYARALTITASGFRIVPDLRSHHFIGRASELSWLADKLNAIDGEVIGCYMGIHGITGVGKTELILKVLELASNANPDDLAIIQLLFRSLSKIRNWLLLISNVREEVDTTHRVLLTDASGRVIISSQLQLAIEKLAPMTNDSLELKELDFDEAVEIFITTTRCEESETNRQSAVDIVRELDFLPHVIDQVASYVRFNNLDLETFLARYRRTPNEALDWDNGYTHRRFSVAKHFSLILQTLEQSHPDSLEVLRFYSILEPEAIPLFETWHRTGEGPGLSRSNEAHLSQSVSGHKGRTCWPLGVYLRPRHQHNETTQASLETSKHPSVA
ncbi:hypothetical protein F4782DRAFT_536274 [Xylaria castorea]|nr:hypothetical protein F4782DRAFT_536274 [Xylaria castorea]